jgi:protein-disulfide isomerase
MFLKKTVLATIIATSLAVSSASASTASICSEVATKEQAELLMKRLFPQSKIITTEPLKLSVSTSCLLEVEMMTDSNNENTKGTVYVLPDGDHFLNGPLMSKRSLLSDQAENTTATAQQSMPEPNEALTPDLDLDPSEQLRRNTLRQLQATPILKYNYSNQPDGTANVLFDAECPYCIKQYKEMEAAAKAHNINFNWIPVYLNERSWAAAALLIKETQTNPASAKQLLDDMMNRKISDSELNKRYKTLNDSDYEKAKETNLIFADILKQANVGTPLTFVENKKGFVSVSSGKLDIEEWGIMLEE